MQKINRLTALLFSLLFAVNSLISTAVPLVPFIKTDSGFQSHTGHAHSVFSPIALSDKSFHTIYLVDDQDDNDDNEAEEEISHFTFITSRTTCYADVIKHALFRPVANVHCDGQPKKFILHCSLKIAC